MILNEDTLKKLITRIVEELTDDDTTTYEFDADDPDLQSKIKKLEIDPVLYDKSKDKIEIKTEEQVYTKKDLQKLTLEKKYNAKVYKKSELVEELGLDEKKEVNPWAVCGANIDKSENPEKYERCVKKVKKSTGYKDKK